MLLDADEINGLNVSGKYGIGYVLPILGGSQANGDGLLRFDVNLDAAALRVGIVGAAGIVIGGIQTQGFLIPQRPVEHSVVGRIRQVAVFYAAPIIIPDVYVVRSEELPR